MTDHVYPAPAGVYPTPAAHSSSSGAAQPLTSSVHPPASSSPSPYPEGHQPRTREVIIALVPPEDQPTKRSVFCAPCRPLTYTVAVYFLLLELPIMGFFSWLLLILTGTSIILLPFFLLGIPVFWFTLLVARLGAKFAAWCYSGLGAEVPHVTVFPRHESHGPFRAMFSSGTSWRSLLFLVIIRPIVATLTVVVLLVLLFIAISFLLSPLVAIIVVSQGNAPSWVIGVGVAVFLVGICLAYCSIVAFPAAAGFLAGSLRITVGKGDEQLLLVGYQGVEVAAAAHRAAVEGQSVQDASHHDVVSSSSSAALVAASGAGMYGEGTATRAFLVPARPHRGMTCCQCFGSFIGFFLCLICVLIFVAAAVVGVIATVASINCAHASTTVDQAYYFRPVNTSAAPLLVNVKDMIGHIRILNDIGTLGDNATDALNPSVHGVPPPDAVGLRLKVKSWGSLSKLRTHYTPYAGPTLVDQSGVQATVSAVPLPHGSILVSRFVERVLLCAAAEVDVVIPPGALPGMLHGSLDAYVGTGYIADHQVASWSWTPFPDLNTRSAATRAVAARPVVKKVGGVTRSEALPLSCSDDATYLCYLEKISLKTNIGVIALNGVDFGHNSTGEFTANAGVVQIGHVTFPHWNTSIPSTGVNVTLSSDVEVEVEEVLMHDSVFSGKVSFNTTGFRNIDLDIEPFSNRTVTNSTTGTVRTYTFTVDGQTAPHSLNLVSVAGELEVESI